MIAYMAHEIASNSRSNAGPVLGQDGRMIRFDRYDYAFNAKYGRNETINVRHSDEK